jgi:hypothetical protein
MEKGDKAYQATKRGDSPGGASQKDWLFGHRSPKALFDGICLHVRWEVHINGVRQLYYRTAAHILRELFGKIDIFELLKVRGGLLSGASFLHPT